MGEQAELVPNAEGKVADLERRVAALEEMITKLNGQVVGALNATASYGHRVEEIVKETERGTKIIMETIAAARAGKRRSR